MKVIDIERFQKSNKRNEDQKKQDKLFNDINEKIDEITLLIGQVNSFNDCNKTIKSIIINPTYACTNLNLKFNDEDEDD